MPQAQIRARPRNQVTFERGSGNRLVAGDARSSSWTIQFSRGHRRDAASALVTQVVGDTKDSSEGLLQKTSVFSMSPTGAPAPISPGDGKSRSLSSSRPWLPRSAPAIGTANPGNSNVCQLRTASSRRHQTAWRHDPMMHKYARLVNSSPADSKSAHGHAMASNVASAVRPTFRRLRAPLASHFTSQAKALLRRRVPGAPPTPAADPAPRWRACPGSRVGRCRVSVRRVAAPLSVR